jgi:hypothetical protein
LLTLQWLAGAWQGPLTAQQRQQQQQRQATALGACVAVELRVLLVVSQVGQLLVAAAPGGVHKQVVVMQTT